MLNDVEHEGCLYEGAAGNSKQYLHRTYQAIGTNAPHPINTRNFQNFSDLPSFF